MEKAPEIGNREPGGIEGGLGEIAGRMAGGADLEGLDHRVRTGDALRELCDGCNGLGALGKGVGRLLLVYDAGGLFHVLHAEEGARVAMRSERISALELGCHCLRHDLIGEVAEDADAVVDRARCDHLGGGGATIIERREALLKHDDHCRTIAGDLEDGKDAPPCLLDDRGDGIGLAIGRDGGPEKDSGAKDPSPGGRHGDR